MPDHDCHQWLPSLPADGLNKRVQFEFQVLESYFGRATGMKLQREDAPRRSARVVEPHARPAVQVGPDLLAPGDDLVGVPVAQLDVGLARLRPEQAAAVLLVELAPPT